MYIKINIRVSVSASATLRAWGRQLVVLQCPATIVEPAGVCTLAKLSNSDMKPGWFY